MWKTSGSTSGAPSPVKSSKLTVTKRLLLKETKDLPDALRQLIILPVAKSILFQFPIPILAHGPSAPQTFSMHVVPMEMQYFASLIDRPFVRGRETVAIRGAPPRDLWIPRGSGQNLHLEYGLGS